MPLIQNKGRRQQRMSWLAREPTNFQLSHNEGGERSPSGVDRGEFQGLRNPPLDNETSYNFKQRMKKFRRPRGLHWGLQCCYYNEDQQEVYKTTFLSRLSETRCQVESHKVHEIFFSNFPSILRALKAMSIQRPFANQFEETIWNWYTDSNSKANSPLQVVSNDNSSSSRLPHCLSVLQPLGIKLKKRAIDFFRAYSHVKELKCAATMYQTRRLR